MEENEHPLASFSPGVVGDVEAPKSVGYTPGAAEVEPAGSGEMAEFHRNGHTKHLAIER